MEIAKSRITAQGQISIPAEVRKRLGLSAASTLAWSEEDGNIVVRRSGKYSSEDIHRALFRDQPPKPRTLEELEEGIKRHIRRRYARR